MGSTVGWLQLAESELVSYLLSDPIISQLLCICLVVNQVVAAQLSGGKACLHGLRQ